MLRLFTTLLHVVACCLELFCKVWNWSNFWTDNSFPTLLLFRDRRSVAQQFWIRLHGLPNIAEATHAHYTWSPKSYVLYPSHDVLQVPTLFELLNPFAHHCQHSNNVESCCLRLHVALGCKALNKWIPKSLELKRIPMHKECKCEDI